MGKKGKKYLETDALARLGDTDVLGHCIVVCCLTVLDGMEEFCQSEEKKRHKQWVVG